MNDKNLSVIISYTGAFIFPRIKNLTINDVITTTNKALLNLLFGGIIFDSITPENVGYGTMYNTGYFLAGGGGTGHNFSFLQALQQKSPSSFDSIKLIGTRNYTKEKFNFSFEEEKKKKK